MIAYQDFVPKRKTAGSLLRKAEFESFDAAVEAANEWIKQNSVKVVTIETVVLPNIHAPDLYGVQEGTRDADLLTMSGWAGWHQFVRVWYEH